MNVYVPFICLALGAAMNWRGLPQPVLKAFDGLMNLQGINMLSPPGTNVISFNVRGLSSGETAGLLDGAGIAVRGGLHCAPAIHRHMGTLETGAVRVSPGAFSTPRDADAFLKAMRVITSGRA